jgi:glutathione peroxidase-family protein
MDFYEQILFSGYTEAEITEIKKLMQNWDKATYPSLANSIVDHANRHNFSENYLKYLRKADNFNKKGAKRKILPNEAIRWNKGNEFIIERNGKIISYGEN